MKLKVKEFGSFGELIIHDIIVNNSPLRVKYGEEFDSKLFEREDFKKSYSNGIIRKCINLGWIYEIKEEEKKKENILVKKEDLKSSKEEIKVDEGINKKK